MCSIQSTGLVFVNTKPLEVSSELTLSIQTSLLGVSKEWKVQGWVVECSREGKEYRVTLLFSNLPSGLSEILDLASTESSRVYPVVDGAEIFGLN